MPSSPFSLSDRAILLALADRFKSVQDGLVEGSTTTYSPTNAWVTNTVKQYVKRNWERRWKNKMPIQSSVYSPYPYDSYPIYPFTGWTNILWWVFKRRSQRN